MSIYDQFFTSCYEPFLGTPPANTSKLYQFYDQLNDGIRYCLHHAQQKNDSDYISSLVINFAIAGLYCGGRYMGEVMEVYLRCQSESSGSLKDLLWQHMAKARSDLAKRRIAQDYSINGFVNTHKYSAYMANVGPILGIPGSENVVEHLGNLNTHTAVDRFMQNYNKDFVVAQTRKALGQDKVHELATQWFKERALDWNQDAYEQKVKTLFQDPQSDRYFDPQQQFESATIKNLRQLHELLNDASSYTSLVDLFNSGQAKKKFSLTVVRMQLRNQLSQMKEHVDIMLKQNAAEREAYLTSHKLQKRARAEALFNYLEIDSLSVSGLLAVIHSKKETQQYIATQLNHSRRSEFLARLHKPEAIQGLTRGDALKDEAIEWLLIGHGILNPPTPASA